MSDKSLMYGIMLEACIHNGDKIRDLTVHKFVYYYPPPCQVIGLLNTRPVYPLYTALAD